MDNSIKIMLGTKDPYLELDRKNFADPVEDQDERIVVQSYPMTCPHCGKPMLKIVSENHTIADQH